MTRKVQCALLGVEAAGLDYVPYPGELGQRIYETISQQAWQQFYFQMPLIAFNQTWYFYWGIVLRHMQRQQLQCL